MKRTLLKRIPAASRDWVDALTAEADPVTLGRFLFWHGEASMAALFSWTPPWPPPPWRTFVQHGLPDWMPMDRFLNTYLPAEELLDLRRMARQIMEADDPPFAGASSDNGPQAAPRQRLRPTAASEKPLDAAYRVFARVRREIRWDAVWGAALPSEVVGRGAGGSLHIAQLCTMLLRSLFIPARIVEEVALAPRVWVDEARLLWRDTPAAALGWLGQRTLYHPFCEVLIGNRWLPLDAQRAQFGWTEMLQHVRNPELLKLAVRSWRDYGHLISRTDRYTIRPLAAGGTAGAGLRRDLGTVRRIAGRHLGQSPRLLDEHEELLERIRESAWRAWMTRTHERTFSAETPATLPPVAEAYLRGAAPTPLRVAPNPDPPTVRETRILLGPAVRRASEPAYLRAVEQGAHLIVLFETWGAGEKLTQELLACFGGSLGPWLAPPHGDRAVFPVRGTGALARAWNDPTLLDLRLVRSLDHLRPGIGTFEIAEGHSPPARVIVWRVRQGKGTITLVPVSLAARADPYAVDFTAGCHRRILSELFR